MRTLANRMLRHLELGSAELSLLLTDDPQIHELNRAHRSKDRPTDVLAFPLMSEADAKLSGGTRLLGDVIVSLDTAEAQAKARGWSLEREVVFLIAHGLLHLVGYDHQTDAQELEMTRMTENLVRAARERSRRRAAAPEGRASSGSKRAQGRRRA